LIICCVADWQSAEHENYPRWKILERRFEFTPCGLPIRDTADCQSSLRNCLFTDLRQQAGGL
jgi:hypothetical protein